jgi:hypothetical protein
MATFSWAIVDLSGVTVMPISNEESTADLSFIEYENQLDSSVKGTVQEIDAYQKWAHALVQDIRGGWPSECLRITFREWEPGNESRDFEAGQSA